MGEDQNDYDRIGERITGVVMVLTGAMHSPCGSSMACGDSVTITKNEVLDSLIELSRLADWVSGLSKTHKVRPVPME